LRSQMLCDYCERPPTAHPCKFPDRHRAPIGQQSSVRSESST
jgi:hypothetical protein